MDNRSIGFVATLSIWFYYMRNLLLTINRTSTIIQLEFLVSIHLFLLKIHSIIDKWKKL